MVEIFIDDRVYAKIEMLKDKVNEERKKKELEMLDISDILGIMVNYFENEIKL